MAFASWRFALGIGLALGASLTGCDKSECERASGAICSRAAECQDGDKVRVKFGGFTVGFDNKSACTQFLQFGCSQDEKPFATPGDCADAVETASCVSTGDAGMAALLPLPACMPPLTPDGGM